MSEEPVSRPASIKAFPWRTAFFVSLGLNLLVVGGVAGAFGSGARLERPLAAVAAPAPNQQDVALERAPAPRAFIAAAPPATRQAMTRDLAQAWRGSRYERGAVRDARVELYDAAVADPYDAGRVKRAFARLREANQAALAPFHERLADNLGAMSAAERRTALDAVFTRPAAGARAPMLTPGPRLRDMPREERRELLRERWQQRRAQRMGQ